MALPPPFPIATASPSSAPHAAQVRALNNELNHLVDSKKVMQASLDKANQDLTDAKEEHKEYQERLKSQWKKERKQWTDLYDTLQTLHNVSQLQTRIILDEERIARCDVTAQVRQQKIATLMRDHKLSLFQARESELEQHILTLEEDMAADRASTAAENQATVDQQKDIIDELKQELGRSAVSIQSKINDATFLKQKKQDIEAELDELKVQYEKLQSDHQVRSLKLDTTEAELVAARTKMKEYDADIRNRDSELKKLKRAEAREQADSEDLVKVKVSLELKIRKLETQIEQLEQQLIETKQELKQEKKRNIALGREVDEVKESLVEAQKEAEDAREGTNAAKQRLASYREQLRQLKQEMTSLEEERDEARARPPAKPPAAASQVKKKKVPPPPSPVPSEGSIHEEIEMINVNVAEASSSRSPSPAPSPQPVKSKPRPKPKPKPKPSEPAPVTVKDGLTLPKAKLSKTQTQKGSVVKPPTKRPESPESDQPPQHKASAAKGKAREKQPDALEKKKAPSANNKDSAPGTKRKAQKRDEQEEQEEEPIEAPVAKKKRKILLGMNSFDKPSHNWGTLGMGVDLGLGIPSTISPIKSAAPTRALFGAKAPAGIFP